jgi:TolA-binding protein
LATPKALVRWFGLIVKEEQAKMNGLRFVFLFLGLAVLWQGCQGKSADSLFVEGEQATHDMASYPVAEAKLSEFIEQYPDDPRADVALQALARVLMNQKKNKEAIDRYETLITDFPQSRYCAQAQFMIGYIYDQLGDEDQAKKAYQKLIDTYPKSELVDDAKISIQNMGKTPGQWLFPKSVSQQ